jgi:hypothetical protein
MVSDEVQLVADLELPLILKGQILLPPSCGYLLCSEGSIGVLLGVVQ